MTSARTSPKSKPFALRLTANERHELERQAGSMPLGTYIKSQLLSPEMQRNKRTARRPVADQAALAQILGMIGQSDVAVRLDALVKAAEAGALTFDDDTSQAIQTACAEVHAMRRLLLKALGFEVSS